MADVFLGYSRDDIKFADALAVLLQRRGLIVWWDVELMPAANYSITLFLVIFYPVLASHQ